MPSPFSLPLPLTPTVDDERRTHGAPHPTSNLPKNKDFDSVSPITYPATASDPALKGSHPALPLTLMPAPSSSSGGCFAQGSS